MTKRTPRALAAIALLALSSAPALAQDTPPQTSIFDGDYLTIGAGGAFGPSYEGSDDYVAFPAAAVMGRVAGVGIAARPAGLALDFINDPKDAKLSLQFGPVVRTRFDRNRQIKDPAVFALGKKDVAVEVGGNVGFSINRITNPYDSLTFSVDVRGDVAGAHEGFVIAPTATFQTPLSQGSFVALSISAEHVDDKYARYYYSVTPAGSQASGLRPYQARAGFKNVGAGLIGAYDLDGDLTNGGFAIFAGVNYSRMLGNFERSPVVADRGSPDQFTGAIGLGFTF
ncbi:MipA/OmpV family protein [Sphingobium sufflavum]|uniref:MipA/OmpV family protein n=1 Tax=Sphingobium sufflavum TaxID=1129547 RepID=UPI001F1F6580|nr:MipA/OmpV family protein [Sphingobium sufflavum]MCE7795972.1 MipA/OmpV family protein [Sphingobium sufflavum]